MLEIDKQTQNTIKTYDYTQLCEQLINGFCRSRIKRFEKWVNHVYWDSENNLTVCWGHNITANWFHEDFLNKYGTNCHFIAKYFTKGMGEMLLTYDIKQAIDGLTRIYGKDKLEIISINRLTCMIDMMFNMGFKRFKTFKNMIRYISKDDYNNAALEIRDSRYWNKCEEIRLRLKEQGMVGTYNRAEENLILMRDIYIQSLNDMLESLRLQKEKLKVNYQLEILKDYEDIKYRGNIDFNKQLDYSN